MKNFKNFIKSIVLVAAVFVAIVCFTGCKKGEVSYDADAALHEGYALPAISYSGVGTVTWDNDTEGLLVANEHSYSYTLINEKGKTIKGSFTLTATPHSGTEVEVIAQPSCTEDGIEVHVCEICSKQYQQQSIEALGHNYIVPVHVDGNCVTYGYTYNICERCQDVQKDSNGQVITTLDQEYGAHVWTVGTDGKEIVHTTTEPQCNCVGEGYVECTLCTETKTVEIPMCDHSYELATHHDGTCLVKGYTTYKCKWCNGDKMDSANPTEVYKEIDTDFAPHKYTLATHTDGDCCNYGYTTYKCEVCQADRMDGNDPTKVYQEFDTTYGAHIYAKNQDGSLVIDHISPLPTCTEEGTGHAYCIHHAEHELGQGNQSADEQTITIPSLGHDYTGKDYHPYLTTTCRTLGYYRHVCVRCGLADPADAELYADDSNPSYTFNEGDKRVYPYHDTEYLDHHYDADGLCDTIYYQQFTTEGGKVSYYTRICMKPQSSEKTYNLGGAPRYSEIDGQYHAGSYNDPSDTVLAILTKIYNNSGEFTGYYALNIVSTEADVEGLGACSYKCYESPQTINNAALATGSSQDIRDIDTWFEENGASYIPWYNDRDESNNLYRERIITVSVDSVIKTLPAGLFYNSKGLESVYFSGTGSLEELPTALFLGCSNLVELRLNDTLSTICYSACYGCSKLTTAGLTIPRGLVTIQSYAFEDCSLSTLDFSECPNLELIGRYAFLNNKVNEVILPSNDISMHHGNNQNLGKAYYGEEGSFDFYGYAMYVNDAFNSEEVEEQGQYINNVFQHDASVYFLGEGKNASDMVIDRGGVQILEATAENPITVKSALRYSENHPYETRTFTDGFIICNTLDKNIAQDKLEAILGETINGKLLGENIVYIGNGAFADCKNITKFVVPHSLVAMGDRAFAKSGLQEIGVLQGNGRLDFDTSLTNLKYIGAMAFNATKLTEVSFPSTMETLGGSIFLDCADLKVINYNMNYQHLTIHGNFDDGKTETQVGVYSQAGAFGLTDSLYVVTVNVGSNVEYLGDCFAYFNGKGCAFNLENATSLSKITTYTFYNCDFKSLDLSHTAIQEIPAKALYNNDSLEEVILPACCTSVGSEAFGNCDKLKTVIFNCATVTVDDKALYQSSAVDYIEINGNITLSGNATKCLYYGHNNDTKTYSFVIGKDVTSIPVLCDLLDTAQVNVYVELGYDTDHYTGFGIQLDKKYKSTINYSNYVKGVTANVILSLDIDSDITSGTIITDLPTELPVYINIGKDVRNINEAYFDTTNYTINISSENTTFIWGNAKDGFHYCDVLSNALGRDFTGAILVDGVEATFAHSWDESEYTPATCEHPSSGGRTCIYCEYSDTEITPIQPHTWVLDITNSTATCETEGSLVYVCSVCETSDQQVGLLPHTPQHTGASCYDIAAKVICSQCERSVFNTDAQGHYYYDEATNTYHLIDAEHDGETCVFCGKEVTVVAAGSNGVVAQIVSLPNGNLSAIVVATGAGTSADANNPLWDYHSTLEEVYIGDTITAIGTCFFDCPSGPSGDGMRTKKLVVGPNVVNIGNQGLGNLFWLEELYFNCKNLTTVKTSTQYWPFTWNGCNSESLSVYVGDGVAQIPNYCFAGVCATDLYIAKSVEKISSNAFAVFSYSGSYIGFVYGNVYYEGNVKDWSLINWNANISALQATNPIGNGSRIAFNGETEFSTTLVIPADMTDAEAFQLAFFDGTFTTIVVEDGNEWLIAIDGCLINKPSKKIILALKDAVIPSDADIVDTIGMGAFAGQYAVNEILLPKNIRTIEQYSFSDTPTVFYLGTEDEYKAISGYSNLNSTAYYYCDLTGLLMEQIQEFENGKYWTYTSDGAYKHIPNGHSLVSRDVTPKEAEQCITKVDVCQFCGVELFTYSHTITEGAAYDCQVGGTLTYTCSACGVPIAGPTNGHGHYDSNGNIITSGGHECAYCHKYVIDVIEMGPNGVICQIVGDTRTSTTYTAWVIATGTGTVISNFGGRGNSPVYKAYGSKIDTIIISDEITVIGTGAFGAAQSEISSSSYIGQSWTNVKTVYIGKGVASIGTNSFYGLDYCETLYYYPTNASNLSGSNNVFSGLGCKTNGLDIIIGANVTNIPSYLFYGYSTGAGIALKCHSLVFEDGCKLTSVGNYAFYGIRGTVAIAVIEDNLTTAISYPFYSSLSFTKVYYKGSASAPSTEDKLIASMKSGYTLYTYSETEPVAAGNYWHYVEGVVTEWVIE